MTSPQSLFLMPMLYLRRMKGLTFILVLSMYVSGQAQDTIALPLCGTDILLLRYGYQGDGVLLYNMHDNENTSALAGRMLALKRGGEYYELVHNGKRNISILFGKDSIHFDPNRIYTDAGIWQQLQKNKNKNVLAHKEIAQWRDSLLSILKIKNRSLIIALHNNTNQNYSFKSYMPGEEFEKEAHALYKGSVRDKDDFYFVTDHGIMHRLSEGKYHVILQANETMTDDGSLSVYCGQMGIPYINVETQHFHLVRQISMLIFAFMQLVEKGG